MGREDLAVTFSSGFFAIFRALIKTVYSNLIMRRLGLSAVRSDAPMSSRSRFSREVLH